ncbi:MAG: acylphosphatase [Simkaniaceae bacterium]|nr:acylphosphatase [Simkaniaceae bacterium]
MAECHHIIVTGRVQGVCFRATTKDLATKLGISGTVQNLPDGTVEIIVHGTQTQANELLAALKASNNPHSIDSITHSKRAVKEPLNHFKIV